MRTSKLILFLLVTLITYSCHEDESLQQGKIQFSFNNVSSSKTGGRKQTDDIPDGSALLISVSKSNGDSVFTLKKIELLKIGDSFTSTPLALPQGNYLLKDFLIVSVNNTVLFAAPKTGSSLAGLVKKPLPVTFSVAVNAVSNADVEVIDANHKAPEDFGYVSFGAHVVPSSGLPIAVFKGDNSSQINFTTATAYILHGQDTVLAKSVQPTVNNLYWTIEPGQSYTLVVIKDGYGKYKKVFRPDSLAAELNGQPLSIVLRPAFTLRWTSRQEVDLPRNPEILFGGITGSKFQVDWGDDSVNDFELTQSYNTNSDWIKNIDHHYASNKNYFVSVTGDLNNLQFFQLLEGIVAIVDTVCITHLPALEEINIVGVDFRASGVDFSHNPSLRIINLSWLHLTTLDISQNPMLTEVFLDGNKFSGAVMDKMIDDLYASVALSNRRNGFLSIKENIFDPASTALIGPPSADRIPELHSLAHDYGWGVTGQ